MVKSSNSNNIWKDIKGRSNSDEDLVEKISLLSPMLSYISSVNTMEIYNSNTLRNDIKKENFDEIFLELLILEMFIIDSILSIIKVKNKAKFKDVLVQEIISVLDLIISERGEESEFEEDEFIKTVNKRFREYSRDLNLKDLDSVLNSEFFNLFRSRISDILILHKNDKVLLDFQYEVIKSIKALQLDELFNLNVKAQRESPKKKG
jgi:hypothetical protein